MHEISKVVALLAPIPVMHLEGGASICAQQGKVAFGSRLWELFRELDEIRAGRYVDVYIYASKVPGNGNPAVTWKGRYIGHVESINGAHPDGMKYRPPSTQTYPSDNLGHWAVFWELDKLSRIPDADQLMTHDFCGYEKKRNYKKGFTPERPLIVAHP